MASSPRGDTGSAGKEGGARPGAATRLKQQVTGQVNLLASKGVAKAAELAEERKEAAAQKLDSVVEVVREFADAAEQRLGGPAGGAVGRGGDAIEAFTASLRNHSVEDMVGQTRSFIVRHPGISLGAASVVGFVAGRIAKAGLAQSHEAQTVEEAA